MTKHEALRAALLAGEPTLEEKLDALCKRLGVTLDQPDWAKFGHIGIILAYQQPEFTGKTPRRKGAPKKFILDEIDVIRARRVELEQLVQKLLTGAQLSITSTLTLLQDVDSYFKADLQSLQNSVSRGRAKLKKLDLEHNKTRQASAANVKHRK